METIPEDWWGPDSASVATEAQPGQPQNDQPGQLDVVNQDLSSMQLVQIQQDSRHKLAVRTAVLALSSSFNFLDDVAEGVYALSQYVPVEAKTNETWSKELIPAMKNALVQNVRINKSFHVALGLINDVAITLRQTADQIMRERGSPESVEIASDELGRVFKRLEDCRTTLDALDLKVLESFERNAELIITSAMGSSVASSWADQIKKYRDQVDQLRRRVIDIENEKAKIMSEIQGLSEYLVSLQKMNGQTEQALKEANERIRAVQQEISATNARMDAIPQTVTTNETHHYSGGWWLWRRRHTETIQRQVRNPNRDADIHFLEAIKKSRFGDIGQHQSEAEREKARAEALHKEISLTSKQLAEKNETLRQYFAGSKENVADGAKFIEEADLLSQIEALQKQIHEVEVEASKAENKYGLRGDVLVNFLVETRSFLSKTEGEAKAITPLITLLNNIESHFRANLRRLQLEASKPTPNLNAVFMAGKAMIREIGLLDSCALALPVLTLPSDNRAAAVQRMRSLTESEAQAAITN